MERKKRFSTNPFEREVPHHKWYPDQRQGSRFVFGEIGVELEAGAGALHGYFKMLGVGEDFADGDLFGTDEDEADVVRGSEENLLGRGDLAIGELVADDEEEAEGVMRAGGHGELAFAAAVAGDPGAGGGGVGGGLLGFSGSVGRFLNEFDGAEVAVDGAAEDVLDFKAWDGGFEFEGELPFVAIFCRDEFTVSEAEAAGPTDLIAGGFFLWTGGPECGR